MGKWNRNGDPYRGHGHTYHIVYRLAPNQNHPWVYKFDIYMKTYTEKKVGQRFITKADFWKERSERRA